jgi:hypothetical protein
MRPSPMPILLAVALLLQTSSSRTVLATISDARNRSIVDVGVDDFVVREAGQTRDVLDVHVADYPIAVILDDGAEAADFDAIRKATARFIARVGQRSVALVVMSDPSRMLTALEDDREAVLKKLDSIAARPTTESRAIDSAATAARALRSVGAPFSAIVVLSSKPVLTSVDAGAAPLGAIVDSGAIVHVVVNRSAAGPAVAPHDADLLRSLADQTHGQFTAIYATASYQVALDHLADRLSAEMLIEYVVPPGAARTTDVKLGVRLPGARVRGLGVR